MSATLCSRTFYPRRRGRWARQGRSHAAGGLLSALRGLTRSSRSSSAGSSSSSGPDAGRSGAAGDRGAGAPRGARSSEEAASSTRSSTTLAPRGIAALLEHALLELWERRAGRMLTLEGYRESGGMAGALAKRAEDVVARCSARAGARAPTFLRLTCRARARRTRGGARSSRALPGGVEASVRPRARCAPAHHGLGRGGR